LDKKLDELLLQLNNGALKDILLQLKTRPTFAEQWPDTYEEALAKGKRRVLQLETIRGDSFTLGDILGQDAEIGKWYESIKT
jgi:hypothetical protein